MKLRLVGLFVCILFIWLSSLPAEAATLYLSPNTAELNRGDTLKLSMRLDVEEDECVNAIDGVVTYSDSIEPVDVSRGSSIMSMWVEEPRIDRVTRTITFAGGIPNGYCGRIVGDPRLTNNIIDILFQSPGFVVGGKQGTSSVEAYVDIAEATQVYLNDGYGSLAILNRFGATIALSPKAGGTIKNDWGAIVNADTFPPDAFSISLDRSENAFSNRYFITFNTTDKQSGIDHYEVIEEPLSDFSLFTWGSVDAPWIETRSPYVLKDQSLNSTIRVRAIDKAGNEYVATLVPPESDRTLSEQSVLLMAIVATVVVVLILLTVLGVMLYRRRRFSSVQSIEPLSDMVPEAVVSDKVVAITPAEASTNVPPLAKRTRRKKNTSDK